jgi:CRISPR/Cas system-associated protein Cas7 (RAMP superfamily)
MFTEISKYIAILSRNKSETKEDEERIKECIKALIYTLIKLTA